MSGLLTGLVEIAVILASLFIGYTVAMDRGGPLAELTPTLRVFLFAVSAAFAMQVLNPIAGLLFPLLGGQISLISLIDFVAGLAILAGLAYGYRTVMGLTPFKV